MKDYGTKSTETLIEGSKDYRIIGILAFALIAVCAAGWANAATAPTSLSFTRPTQYVDGSPLPASAITSYTLACEFTAPGATNATPCTTSTTTIPGGSTTGTLTLTYPATGGTACFTLKTNVGAVQSVSSSPAACKTLDGLAPNPPSNVTVTVTLALTVTSASPITVAMGTPVVTKTP